MARVEIGFHHNGLNSNSIKPTQRGPATAAREWTDELSGVIYSSVKPPSHYWRLSTEQRKRKKKNLLLVH